MFERYTESARQAIFWALHVAHESGSAFIETDHLLAGLLGADAALAQQYPGLAEFAPKSAAHAAPPPILEPVPRRELPLSSEAKRALDYAAEESQRVADRHIGTEHLLLGMLREEGSRAAEAIRGAGFELSQLRAGLLLRQAKDPLLASRSVTPAEASGAVPGVLARYTEKARRTIFFSRFEASQFGAKSIESEHLLLGLMREYSHLRDLLAEAGTSPREIRKEIEQRKPPAAEKVPTSVDLPLSHDCKRAMAFATEEADRLNHKHIGNEHLLAGLLREENCLAELLRAHGITLDTARTDLEKGDSST